MISISLDYKSREYQVVVHVVDSDILTIFRRATSSNLDVFDHKKTKPVIFSSIAALDVESGLYRRGTERKI
jgi:hypothetical protein